MQTHETFYPRKLKLNIVETFNINCPRKILNVLLRNAETWTVIKLVTPTIELINNNFDINSLSRQIVILL